MNIVAINGSPRKHKNTSQLLQSALEGVGLASQKSSVLTELINLYDYQFSSCKSCFACKRRGGKYYGRCMINDSLTPLLEKVIHADGLIFGSPIYFGSITGKMKSFFERLLYPISAFYTTPYSSIAPKKMPTAFIYTMNVTTETMQSLGYPESLQFIENAIGRVFSPPTTLYVCDTMQFDDDYSLYKTNCFFEEAKKEHHNIQFPLDMKKAFDIGGHIFMMQ